MSSNQHEDIEDQTNESANLLNNQEETTKMPVGENNSENKLQELFQKIQQKGNLPILQEKATDFGIKEYEKVNKVINEWTSKREKSQDKNGYLNELWKLRGFPSSFGIIAYAGLSYIMSKYAWDEDMYNEDGEDCKVIIDFTRLVAYYCYAMTALYFFLFLFDQICMTKDEKEFDAYKNAILDDEGVQKKKTKVNYCYPEIVLLCLHFIMWSIIFCFYLVNMDTGEDCGAIMNVITCITILNVIAFALLVLTVAYLAISVDWKVVQENIEQLKKFQEITQQEDFKEIVDLAQPVIQDIKAEEGTIKEIMEDLKKKANELKEKTQHDLEDKVKEGKAQIEETKHKLEDAKDKLNETKEKIGENIDTVQKTTEQ